MSKHVLMVSHDAGCSYFPSASADDLEGLRSAMDAADRDWLRWYVETDGEQDFSVTCSIHRGILETFAATGKEAPDATD